MPRKRRMKSYEMIDERMKEHYLRFYDASYRESKAISPKNKELIAIAASLVAQCQGCVQGHIKKAISMGATREEISEAIVIAVGVNAAAVVDQTDIANFEEDFITMMKDAEETRAKIAKKAAAKKPAKKRTPKKK